jgi:outer membrane PBP1 activator LpoA protein
MATLSTGELSNKTEAAAARGNFVIAAQGYLQLAKRSENPLKEEYQLTAANILVRGRYIDEAKKITQQLHAPALPLEQRLNHQMLLARFALLEQQPNEALSHLRYPGIESIPASLITKWRHLRAETYAGIGNHLESVRERISLEALLSKEETISLNHQLIWKTLNNLSESALTAFHTQPPPDILSGWLELSLLGKRADPDNSAQFERELNKWQLKYTEHPARGEFLDLLLNRQDAVIDRPENIALLLPLTGNFARPANAVRDGFLAAYYARPNQRYTPSIKVYDTSDDLQQGLNAYNQAITEGADFIIGPLHKPLLEELAKKDFFPVPTLALNYLSNEEPSNDKLYQYGLLPEDEARQVAERAWLDGHNNALILVPEGEWGTRMQTTFQQHWEMLEGTISESQTYNASKHDFSGPVVDLLNIDQSKARHRKLEKTIGIQLEFKPRRRQDIDFIYVAAFPRQARQIRPQLKFYYATDIPIYSTSHVYSGEIDTSQDRDVNGIIFCDMPWVFTSGKGHQPEWNDFINIWKSGATPYKRLYAMGIDAYRLISQLDQLSNSQEQLSAETGNLYIDDANRIHRQLLWARFRGGKPRLIEALPLRTNDES